MWKHLHLLMSLFSLMAFTTDSSGDGDQNSDDPPGKDDQDQKDDKRHDDPPADRSTWTEEQWQAEIQRVAAKEKAEGRKAAQREHQQQQDEAKRKADLEKQESEGKYEEAKGQITSERDTAVAERDQALELLKANVDTQWDDLPEEVRATYKGEEDDVLAKSSHMNLMKPVIDRLKGEAEKADERNNPGNPKNPKPTDKKTTTEEDETAKRTVRPRL